MIKYEKKAIEIEVGLKKRIEFICDFVKVKPTFITGNVISINKTNIQYVEPHRIIIKSLTFLAFNYSNELYINNLSKVIKLKDLEEFLKSI